MSGTSVRIIGRLALLFITGVTLVHGQGIDQTVKTAYSSTRSNAILVELFTSEGCSSCPPADALLRQINGTRTTSGQLIVGISEHVTYWNSLGWSDPYSSSTYTNRQNSYGDRFGLESVYTPQMVINGEEQIVGSDGSGLINALKKEQGRSSPVILRILATTLTDASLKFSFTATGAELTPGAEMIAVITDDADQSNVLRGENSGATLTHVAVARSLSRVSMLKPTTEQTVEIQLPSSYQKSKGHHLILFLQAPRNGRVLGTDTKAL